MTSWGLAACFMGYFALLLLIAWFSNRGQKENLADFFLAGRRARWYVVAFGMIGTSISGVTFISVPGAVRNDGLGYMQVVLGYLAGYVVITWVLLPLYYRLQLTSIYGYLKLRFGFWGYKTGAAYFLLSRALGTSVRLYLVANVLQLLIFGPIGLPFWATVALILGQILIYTARGGVKTILWTDLLQTSFLIGAVVCAVVVIGQALPGVNLPQAISSSPYKQMFFWDWHLPNYFWKQFLSGMFICITMTGLDQGLMQKNLACRNLREAQWNVASYSIALAIVTYFFLLVGLLLYSYATAYHVALPHRSDDLFGLLAMHYFGPVVAVLFVLGLTAAAYGSSDEALTSLTTSFCIDILGIENLQEASGLRLKRRVHLATALLTFLLILGFKWSERFTDKDFSVIALILKMAVYTYGPLLGLFAFGILTRRRVNDGWLPLICVVAPLCCLVLSSTSKVWLGGYTFGNELIVVNGGIVFLGAWLVSEGSRTSNMTN